jgi:hypothetical protein
MRSAGTLDDAALLETLADVAEHHGRGGAPVLVRNDLANRDLAADADASAAHTHASVATTGKSIPR